MRRDSVAIAKQKRESNRLPTHRLISEPVKLEITNIPKPLSKDKYILLLFVEHSFFIFHKPSQFTSPDSISLPKVIALLNEIRKVGIDSGKKMLVLTLDNKAEYKVYFKKLETCERINDFIKDKIKIINSYYGGAIEKDRVYGKYFSAAYFEASFALSNYFRRHTKTLKTNYLDFFSTAFEGENKEVFINKLWYGKFKKFEKITKDAKITDIIAGLKDRSSGEKEVFGLMLLSKQNIDYSKEDFENYIKHYCDILDNQFLPEWISPNLLYLFDLNSLAKGDTSNRLSPFTEFISFM